ncbi:SDR family NAD(P)-dependent oxidoreductase [Limnohabitans sp. 2KL-51]|uniref:SDR family NAD(P)-dependent oxidoreductase n=1 Tax=Limnohabitans sp. 2KL-51 TaxID=1977911 RepID=UPI000D3CDA41|nr:glucose 1-dehydrogenase [Limnohabitans sp. 2KL-51]PUE46051.1 oxidoreductase [Limnohabitans sp. 2KL-51]
MNDLKDKVVLITGSSTGIGAAAAVAFGKLGARVAVHYNSSQGPAEEVLGRVKATGAQAILLKGDVLESAQCQRLVDETVKAFGRIDILINNAGALVQRVPIEEITDELFDNVVYLNVRSAMMCTAAAVAAMRQQGQGGVVINVTSVAARHGGGAGASLYAGSKGFVSTMTRGLAKELVKDNIRVNAVAPGVITTPFHERFSTPQMLEGFRATIPMNRLGTAEECAGAFVYLASEQMSGYVTGQIIEVNGGQYMP